MKGHDGDGDDAEDDAEDGMVADYIVGSDDSDDEDDEIVQMIADGIANLHALENPETHRPEIIDEQLDEYNPWKDRNQCDPSIVIKRQNKDVYNNFQDTLKQLCSRTCMFFG
eukprot:Awhi_evm1s8589